jgi:hypothetical protein
MFLHRAVKLNKINISTVLALIALFSFFELMIIIKFYFDSLLENHLVWLIVYSSLLIICSSITGTIVYTTVEPDKIFELNTGLFLILSFLIIWGFFGFYLNTTFFIVATIVTVLLTFGWILSKTSNL